MNLSEMQMGQPWTVPYSQRFENVFASATVRVNSGKLATDGSWDAQRTEPLSAADPGIYAMEWKSPQSLRGLALREVDGAVTEVDVFTGPAGAPAACTTPTATPTTSATPSTSREVAKSIKATIIGNRRQLSPRSSEKSSRNSVAERNARERTSIILGKGPARAVASCFY